MNYWTTSGGFNRGLLVIELTCLCLKHNRMKHTTGVPSLTYPRSSIPPGIINLGPTYRGYIQPRFNIPPGVYGT